MLTFYTAVPSPTGGYTHIGDVAIYVAGLLFGPYVGFFVGLIGPVTADLLVRYPRWYVTLVAHGIQGFVVGYGRGRKIHVQFLLSLVAGLAMCLTYFIVNIFVKGFAPAVLSLIIDFFGQTLVSVIISIPVVKGVEKSGILPVQK